MSDLERKTAADSIQKPKVLSNSDQGQHCGTTHKKQTCSTYAKKVSKM